MANLSAASLAALARLKADTAVQQAVANAALEQSTRTDPGTPVQHSHQTASHTRRAVTDTTFDATTSTFSRGHRATATSGTGRGASGSSDSINLNAPDSVNLSSIELAKAASATRLSTSQLGGVGPMKRGDATSTRAKSRSRATAHRSDAGDGGARVLAEVAKVCSNRMCKSLKGHVGGCVLTIARYCGGGGFVCRNHHTLRCGFTPCYVQVRSDMSKQMRELQDTLMRERQARIAESDTFVSSLRKQVSTMVGRADPSHVSAKLATGELKACSRHGMRG